VGITLLSSGLDYGYDAGAIEGQRWRVIAAFLTLSLIQCLIEAGQQHQVGRATLAMAVRVARSHGGKLAVLTALLGLASYRAFEEAQIEPGPAPRPQETLPPIPPPTPVVSKPLTIVISGPKNAVGAGQLGV
jgi:hypothetical protein